MKHIFDKNYAVIIFATNDSKYLQFAFNCARSVLVYNQLSIYIVTNITADIPVDLKKNVFFVLASEYHASLGIGMKLYIDHYLQTEHSLFLDADCLCYGSLWPLFADSKNESVTVVGNIVETANWCTVKQAETIYQVFGLARLIRYNGGLYYIRKSQLTKAIFNQARTTAASYDEYGFDRIKNRWLNEEVPLSIAMTIHQQIPLQDDGRYMTDLYTDHRPKILNVLKGQRLLKNPPLPALRHRPWYPESYSPIVLHFTGSKLRSYPYIAQTLLLRLYSKSIPAWLSSYFVSIFITPVFKLYYWLK